MAVVTGASDLFPTDPLDQPMPTRRAGVRRAVISSVANAGTDSNGSMYKLASLPSHVILAPGTLFDVEAWGFAQVVIGTKDDTDALLDVARSAATTQSPIAWGDANHGLELWQVLGLASDPGGDIDLYAHAEADATGAGSMPFVIEYFDTH